MIIEIHIDPRDVTDSTVFVGNHEVGVVLQESIHICFTSTAFERFVILAKELQKDHEESLASKVEWKLQGPTNLIEKNAFLNAELAANEVMFPYAEQLRQRIKELEDVAWQRLQKIAELEVEIKELKTKP